jgi:hypothetical protein
MTLNFLNRFSKNSQTPNLMKIRPVVAELFQADRQDRHDRSSDRFSQFCECAYKLLANVWLTFLYTTLAEREVFIYGNTASFICKYGKTFSEVYSGHYFLCNARPLRMFTIWVFCILPHVLIPSFKSPSLSSIRYRNSW